MSLSNLVSGPLPSGSPSGSGGAQSNAGSGGGGVGKIDLGLARMSALMQALSPTPIPAIHLAGTNGKGSVSALLESVLLASGLRVGRYNSPHLIEPRDAIRVDGVPPPREEYEWCKSRVIHVSKTKGIEATTFEIATAAAYFLLGRSGVEVMIVECGMGGARDATNVLDPSMVLASGLTAVGLDHTAFLGDTIEAIAEEKAKIAVTGGLLVVAPQPYPQASSVAALVAQSRGATAIQAPRSTVIESSKGPASIRPWSPPQPAVISTPLGPDHDIVTRLNLPGEHQVDNLSLALAILQGVRTDSRARKILPRLAQISDEAIRQGVEWTRWAGRCSWEIYGGGGPVGERSGPSLPVLVDGAHNADSATTLRAYLDSLGDVAGAVRWIISLSDSKGKSVESVLSPLLRRGDEVVAMEFGTPVEGMPWVQPVSAEEVARVARRLVGSASEAEAAEAAEAGDAGGLVSIIKQRGSEGVKEALDARRTEEKLVVLCGSLYLVADFYRLLSTR